MGRAGSRAPVSQSTAVRNCNCTHTINRPNTPQERNMPKTTPEQNKASLSKPSTFSSTNATTKQQNASGHQSISSTARTLRRDVKDCSLWSAHRQIRCATKTNSSSQKETTSSHMAVSLGQEGRQPGLQPTLSDLKTVFSKSIGTFCRTKRPRPNPSAVFPCSATHFPSDSRK